MQPSKSTHRQSLIGMVAHDIRQRVQEESLPFHVAATRVLIQWLGYDLDDINFIDDPEINIDAWLNVETGLDIFIFKVRDLNAIGTLNLDLFDRQATFDLNKVKHLLLNERAQNITHKKLKQLMHEWDSAIRNHKLGESAIALSITIHLVLLGEDLTPQAQTEFQSFQTAHAVPQQVDTIPVQFHAVLHTINQIIDEKWREENRTWKDLKGHKLERIDLQPWNEGSISDNANAIFYCRAIDLVRAYDALGYQLFEPNVRANIKNSRVNQAIKESVLHQRTRKEFRFLNNGVTITCDSFAKPHAPRRVFTVTRPGIVNGLQTVVSLHIWHEGRVVEVAQALNFKHLKISVV